MVVGCLQVSVGGMRASRHLAVSSLAFATRNMASGAAVVDQMLTYVWGDLQGKGPAAVDVLRSGLSLQPDPNKGSDSARLHIALTEAFAAEHDWAQAAASSQAAAAAAAAATATAAPAPDLASLAGFQAVRALLVSGKDQEATDFTNGTTTSSSSSSVTGVVDVAHRLVVQHASGAPISQLQRRLQDQLHSSSGSGSSSSNSRLHDVLMALSQKVAGDAALAQGNHDEAKHSFDAAHKTLTGSSSSSNAGSSSSSSSSAFQSDVSCGLSSRFQHEVAADVAAGAAQVAMCDHDWSLAEDHLAAALKHAEAAAGQADPALTPVLLLLATVYARQARVMFAEGMLRECSKLLGGTEPQRLVEKSSSSSSSSRQAVHPSITAAVCWRYCQLLTALPNRTAEAAAWGAAAKQIWCQSKDDIESVLGGDVALKGQGRHGHGRGAVVSLFLRRLLPAYSSSSSSADSST